MPVVERIAIVGMAVRLPGVGADLSAYWDAIVSGRDCSREVPSDRWLRPPEAWHDPRIPHPDSVYSTRSYTLDRFEPDSTNLSVDASFLAELDPLFHLALDVGHRAWRSARTQSVDRRKVGVILGNICLPTDRASDLAREYLGGRVADAIGRAREARQTLALNRYVAGLPAGLLAQALRFGGGTFTLDAACASSLYAVKLACDALLAGRADAMLAGGLNRSDSLYTQMGFSQLRALSPSGRCSPFDQAADGLMVGEGAGIFVLKRLSDALRVGDTIHGVICGVGLSNDMHGNLLAPAREGQLRAMQSAYGEAWWKPTHPDLIECHATGTPVGDAVEFESLRELWGTNGWTVGQCAIGSVKSTVGHLLTGAGAAALAKVLLALSHKTRPPQANFQTPGSNLSYRDGPFQVLREAEVWNPRRPTLPRRAAVSGFGFGGVNAHLLVEEYVGQTFVQGGSGVQAQSSLHRTLPKLVTATTPKQATASPEVKECPIAVVGMAAHGGPWDSLRMLQERVLNRDNGLSPLPKVNGWGLASEPCPPGFFIENLVAPLDRFRIPPKEIEEMLPQQLLMLTVAAAALDDCTAGSNTLGSKPGEAADPRSGVYIGLGLDLNTTNFHLRWAAKTWVEESSAPAGRAASLLESVGPALNANRTMGALGSIAASRIARTFHFGGPSFTVCSEESSSGRAIELAVRALRAKELDRAVVGGVDLGGDPRLVLPDGADVRCDGAAALVLKRLDDAERDGDRVYAVLGGVGTASGGTPGRSGADSAAWASSLMRACSEAMVAPATVDYLDVARMTAEGGSSEAEAIAALLTAQPRELPLSIGCVRDQVGNVGAAGAVFGVVKACLALYQQILPPTIPSSSFPSFSAEVTAGCHWSGSPRYWLKDDVANSPRRVIVASGGVDGSVVHLLLEEHTKAVVVSPIANEFLQPLGRRSEAVFALEASDAGELLARLDRLESLLHDRKEQPIESLAREWFALVPQNRSAKRAMAFVARSGEELLQQSAAARESLRTAPERPIPNPSEPDPRAAMRDRVFYSPAPLGPKAKLAFVYPGSGNHFAGMGRELGTGWPEVLRRQQSENKLLRSQYAPDSFWAETIRSGTTAKDFLFGQVTLGTLVSDILVSLGVKADALIGQSLGESAGLFGLRVWLSRDEMYRRIRKSSLFGSDLAPPYDAARRFWSLPSHLPLEWISGVLAVSADDVRHLLRPGLRVYLLIVTTPTECVIGGVREDVEKFLEQFSAPFFPLPGVTLAHCEAGKPVEAPYRALHTLPCTPPPGLRVYSGAYARPYAPTPDHAADSITAGLLNTIDFPQVVRAAYRDGVRFFVEVGPGNSTTRMISASLGEQRHVARAVCVPRQDDVSLVLRLAAHLLAERGTVDLSKLYGVERIGAASSPSAPATSPSVRIPVGMPPHPLFAEPEAESPVSSMIEPPHAATPRSAIVEVEAPESPFSSVALDDFDDDGMPDLLGVIDPIDLIPPPPTDTEPELPPIITHELPPVSPLPPVREPEPESVLYAADTVISAPPSPLSVLPATGWAHGLTPYVQAAVETQRAAAEAHESFLRVQSHNVVVASEALQVQSHLVSKLLGYDDGDGEAVPDSAPVVPETVPATPDFSNGVPRALDTQQCFQLAVGKLGDVLGPLFAEVDAHPTRVRLPDGPLMLVDRILAIEGEPRSMTRGRVVTEHHVHRDRWYLDSNRIPTCIAVESGQADLFLSGFLGIDFETKGHAVYRLLDAVVTFHRALPTIGDTIRYDIHIDEFFRQSDTWLFRFHFESTVNGEPLLSMSQGIAGFFTSEALNSGKGIIHTKLDLRPMPGKLPVGWEPLLRVDTGSLDAAQVAALREGNLVAAFGREFANVNLRSPMKLPGGMLRLLDRVPHYDPNGGRFGIGFIRAEYDIHPDDWFLTCHFVDDMVMPGTLMYECCLHTLRVLLMRMGWIGEEGEVACEPVPGVSSRLKCRGQVIDSTRLVTYEVTIKELGFGPEPFCIADALMYADGKPIVEITNMSLRMAGLTKGKLDAIWGPPGSSTSLATRPGVKPAIYDSARILAYSNGNPSEAFGEPYRIFDHGRVIARLPGPPFQFLDRITAVTGEPFVLAAGASCEAQYDVPRDAWYFRENRSTRMPFSVLLEIALQPCGWLAAYCGSALTSETDLSFRNLGGKATQFLEVTPEVGTLTITSTMTNVSKSGGMIIQHFAMKVMCSLGTVYEGTTYFGFFDKAALVNQIGMPQAKVPYLTPDDRTIAEAGLLPSHAPFPAPMMRMVDRIEGYLPSGGRAGLGLVQGSISVDPSFWFFQAHFYQDPVWPGSLGLESFLQLLKFAAWKRWGDPKPGGWQTVGLNRPQEWIYRGQVVPKDRTVTVVLEITAVDEAARRLTADGFLTVDGRIIYQMKDFTLE